MLDMICPLVMDLSACPGAVDSVVRACTAVAFWGRFCLGELLLASQKTFLPNFYPAFESWHNGQFPTIVLPWTKTTCTLGATIILFKQTSMTCPIANMKLYLASTALAPGSPLFAYKHPVLGRP
jgi:hypothetical protein